MTQHVPLDYSVWTKSCTLNLQPEKSHVFQADVPSFMYYCHSVYVYPLTVVVVFIFEKVFR